MTVSRRIFMRGTVLAPAVLATPALMRFNTAHADGVSVPRTPQVQRRMVGEIEVIALMDGMIQRPKEMIPGYDEAKARAAAELAHKPHDPAAIAIGINGYVIRLGDRVIAVDTGSPAGLAPTLGGWHAALAAAGIATDEVDTVFLTHLHPDHVGGMADPKTGAARLPRARMIASEADWAFTFDAGVYASMPKEVQRGLDISRAMVAPYATAKTLVTPGDEIASGLTSVPMSGHTPGHMGLRLDSGRESLLIWGDLADCARLPVCQSGLGFRAGYGQGGRCGHTSPGPGHDSDGWDDGCRHASGLSGFWLCRTRQTGLWLCRSPLGLPDLKRCPRSPP